MGKFTEFLDHKTPEEKSDKIMEKLMEDKFNAQLKSRYSEILKNDHQFYRTNNSTSKRLSNFKKVTFTVLSLLVLALGTYIMSSKFISNNQEKAQQYLAENTIQYHGLTRNSNNAEILRAAGANSFNARDYNQAIIEFSKIENPTSDDKFYLAYSYLRLEKYMLAASLFEELNKTTTGTEKYSEEIQLFYALSLFASNNPNFEIFVKSIEEKKWARKEIAKITGY